ncbi:MAG: 2-C-methyl-D-erythritol 2,4-cyclodiphosphate synthase [Acidobacteria bacterium]|nr:MAG: 2-C-methyl-D-erythritol 2,4-cyclodiphosphate synthase [Acidobacteriota bacterium]
MHVTAIIAAGGRGRRLGADVPKQLLALAGRPMLQWSVEAFLECPAVREVIVAAAPEVLQAPPDYLLRPRVSLVAGGERRQDSVANAVEALPEYAEIAVIHDAARPLVTGDIIERTIAAAAESGAAIAAVASRDTVKRSTGTGEDRLIDATLPREEIFLAQTPQAFRIHVLRDAVAEGRRGAEGTDEAALAELAGHRVRLVEGSARNLKITTVEDLAIAEALIAMREDAGAGRVAAARIGTGYDLHRLVEGRPLILGGVTIPFDRGLAGHSDADVLAHAITDAILGAASQGDIGLHFPDTDPRWHGASSLGLLAQAASLVRARGYAIVNVDASVIAERPKLGPHRAAMVASLASALGLPCEAVSVKAKTNEGVDATGRGEAIAVHAVALLEKRAAGSGQLAASPEGPRGA